MGKNYFFGSYNSFQGLFNKYGVATLGFSLRKLDENYTGNCIKVLRDSDNATLDIGFVNNVIDIISLLAFIGSGTGYVQTWYSQGIYLDATELIKANMPQIVNGGILETKNGKPAIRMNNKFFNLGYSSDFNLVNGKGYYAFGVISTTNLNSIEGYFGRSLAASIGGRYSTLKESPLMYSLYEENSGNIFTTDQSILTTNNQTIICQWLKIGFDATQSNVKNGNVVSTSIPTIPYNNTLSYTIGSYASSGAVFPMDGHIQEIVAYYENKEADKMNINNDVNAYYGTY